MKILDRIKEGLKEFYKALGPDIEDETMDDLPIECQNAMASVAKMEQGQEALENARIHTSKKMEQELKSETLNQPINVTKKEKNKEKQDTEREL